MGFRCFALECDETLQSQKLGRGRVPPCEPFIATIQYLLEKTRHMQFYYYYYYYYDYYYYYYYYYYYCYCYYH